MPATPHPCFDPLAFYLDTGDSKVHLRTKVGGGVIVDADGVSVVFPDDIAFAAHFEKADGAPFAVPSPLFGGIINPTLGGPGGTPVTSVMTGAPFTLPSEGTVWVVMLAAYANMKLLPPEGVDSEAGLELTGSVDGVNYVPLHNVSYIVDSAGKLGPAGGFQRKLQVELAAGATFTPTFVINYLRESAAGDADYIKATTMRYQFTVHRRS